MKKKIFTLLLAVAANVGTIYSEVINGTCGENLTWSFNTEDSTLTIEGSGAMRFNHGSGLSSTDVPWNMFCSSIKYISLPDGLKSIGFFAFCNCIGLTSVTIPNSVTSIESWAFRDCIGLTSVTIPNSVTSIGYDAFKGVLNVIFTGSATGAPWGAKSVNGYVDGYLTFSDNSKTALLGCSQSVQGEIIIPNSVTSIGEAAFEYCSGLTSINVVTDNPNYCSVEGVLFNKDKTVLVQCPGGKEGDYTIPNSVTSIGESAFRNCSSLTSVTIPNSVTSIGESAFGNCTGLKNVILGTSVKVLEEYAFYRCSAIETITCYSMRPPTVNEDALYGLDYGTIVYVPADYLETYKMHNAWGLYDVRPLGAKGTETTNLSVTPAETTADVAWPAIIGAATYELVIKDKGGNVICTLVFNANGQLTQIAFNAPARNNAPQQTQAAGFSFTVTGLENGTSYDLTITSKDNSGTTLDTKTISFTTSGDVPQGIEDVLSDQVQCTKVMRNGQVFILRGDKTYTLQGQEVK